MKFLSFSDNKLEEVPRHILVHMPNAITIDLSRGRIRKVSTGDFRNSKDLRYLVLVENNIQLLEKDSIPTTLSVLHLARNNLTSLNGTVRDIQNLTVLFVNDNQLTSLDNELPLTRTLKSLVIHHNKLTKLPQELKLNRQLDTMFISDNLIQSFDGIFRDLTLVNEIIAPNNRIEYLADDEFQNAHLLFVLDLSRNNIKSLNHSLLPVKSLVNCNISRNSLSEFSLNEIRGLENLKILDLSHNRIEKLSGRMENTIEPDLYVLELILNHNRIKSLDGAMMGMNRLRTLKLAYNQLKWISPDDLIGLEQLEHLNVSHNDLRTLEETSKVTRMR